MIWVLAEPPDSTGEISRACDEVAPRCIQDHVSNVVGVKKNAKQICSLSKTECY